MFLQFVFNRSDSVDRSIVVSLHKAVGGPHQREILEYSTGLGLSHPFTLGMNRSFETKVYYHLLDRLASTKECRETAVAVEIFKLLQFSNADYAPWVKVVEGASGALVFSKGEENCDWRDACLVQNISRLLNASL